MKKTKYAIHFAMLTLRIICTIIFLGGKNMAFRLNTTKKETENKTIRFPVPLIEDIEKRLENTEVSFSGFVIQACEYALKNMEEEKNND